MQPLLSVFSWLSTVYFYHFGYPQHVASRIDMSTLQVDIHKYKNRADLSAH
jgi:hypothetical protein